MQPQSLAPTPLRKGLCAASCLQQVGNGGDEGFCLAPPSKVLPLGRKALWLDGMVCCSSTSFQAPPLEGSTTSVAPLPRCLPWERSILLSPVISQRVIHQPSIQRLFLPQWCESVLALQAAAVTGFSWSQLTSQQHLPSTFSLIRVQSQLIRVQSQHSLSFSISLPPFPLLFLLYILFYFIRPSLM